MAILKIVNGPSSSLPCQLTWAYLVWQRGTWIRLRWFFYFVPWDSSPSNRPLGEYFWFTFSKHPTIKSKWSLTHVGGILSWIQMYSVIFLGGFPENLGFCKFLVPIRIRFPPPNQWRPFEDPNTTPLASLPVQTTPPLDARRPSGGASGRGAGGGAGGAPTAAGQYEAWRRKGAIWSLGYTPEI